MSVKHVGSLPEFNQILRAAGAKLVVVDFHATWCGPCHAIAPHYERLARQYTGRAIFLKVDVDAAEDVAQHFNISAMPTFHFHLRSRLVAQISGADPAELDSNVARYAPDTADVSFSGEGQRLTSDSPTTPTSTIQSARESAAAAAARRMENARAAAAAARAAELQSSASSPRPSASASASASNALRPQSFSPPPSNGNDARLKVNETLLRQMVEEMGFPRVRAEKALILTGNRGLESAVEWCFEHAEDADIDEPLQVVTKDGASKPRLSPEEAKRRADELTARARIRREADEKKEAIERERSRLRSGKEISAARVKLEEEERKRAVEEKRRIKREALAERQRVREMLEADKQRRHERFNMGGARPTPQPAPVPLPRQTMPSASAAAGMIQFRMPDGSRIEGEFEAGNTIADLVSFLVGKRPELSTRMITLSQQYPRKSYSQGDYNLLLGDLKLLPRGALAVSFS